MLKLSGMEDPCIFIPGERFPLRKEGGGGWRKVYKRENKKVEKRFEKSSKGARKIGLVNVNQVSQIFGIFLYFLENFPSDLGISNNTLMFSRFSIANVTFKGQPPFKKGLA
ncbi:uncharacterized protein TNCV_3037651 [Trichonephila clavipes]|nr:uncharacterized protein TNCV_3037651 [Trichonephila clavipes]